MMNKDDQVVGISTATSIRPFSGVALLSTTVYGSNNFCTCYTILRATKPPTRFLSWSRHATPRIATRIFLLYPQPLTLPLTTTFPPSFHKSHSRTTPESSPTTTCAPSSFTSVGHGPALSARNPASSSAALNDTAAPLNVNPPIFLKVPPHPTVEAADHSIDPDAEFRSVAPFRMPTWPSSPVTFSSRESRWHES